MSCSYFFGVGWRIYTTMFIDYENNQMVDVFNGYETFYNYYGFIDENGVHMEGP